MPRGISRCPNCGAISIKPGGAAIAGLAVAAQLITACACYGGPVTCTTVTHRGMPVSSCSVADCATPLPDGGNPRADGTDFFCADGSMNDPLDGGSDGG